MEKIKASEVFAIIAKNYKYLSKDTDGAICISGCVPYTDMDEDDNVMWLPGKEYKNEDSMLHIDTQQSISKSESLSSLREIDFSEDFAQESQEQSTNKSIFQEGDIVHVLSYSNQGELGVSTQGVVKAIKSNSFIAVEIVNGIEEIHQEKNISFTPFSIHEAGFSQVRPVKEPKVGDWGFFYDNNETPCDALFYGRLELIKDESVIFRYKVEGRSLWRYFSHTPPQLAEGIPNPFKEC